MSRDSKLDTAFALLQQGLWSEAYTAYVALLDDYNDDVDVLHQFATVCAHVQQFDKARELLTVALKLAPRSATLYDSLGHVASKAEDPKAAIQHYQKALQLASQSASLHHHLANAFRQLGEVGSAFAHYQQARLQAPADEAINRDLASYCLQQKRTEQAKEVLLQALHAKPRAASLLNQLAYIYCMDKAFTRAQYCYEQLIALQPDELFHYNNLAACLMGQQDYQAALPVLADALAIDAEHGSVRMNMALCFLQLSRFDQAIYHYLICQKQGDKSTELSYNLGVAYMQKGCLQEALQAFSDVLAKAPETIDAHNNIAACCLRLQKEQQAIEHYQQVLTIEPKNAIANYALAALTQSTVPSAAPASYVQGLFDNYASHFDEHAAQGLAYCVPDELARLLNAHLAHAVSTVRILDLGCGTGLSAKALMTSDRELIGFDLSIKMLRQAQHKGIYHLLVQGDLSAWPFEAKHVDVIVAADVLVYLGDLRALFARVVQTLDDGGVFAFTVESCQHTDYQLLTSGRYAHNVDYLMALAREFGLELLVRHSGALRRQEQAWLQGEYIVFRLVGVR